MLETYSDFSLYLEKLCSSLNISLTSEMLGRFYEYYHLLIERNKSVNLTAITDPRDVCLKHFFDSLSITAFYDFSRTESIIDIGSGGGFPGIPLKIFFPEKKIVLIDSLNKRVSFLNDTVRDLDLENIYAIHGRAEDLGHDKKFREQFDLAVSRAVSNLSTLSEYCLPFVKIGGSFVAYKSLELDNELDSSSNAIKSLGGKLKKPLYFDLDDYHRSFAIIEKIDATSTKYPRKAGTPLKKPL